MNGHTIGYFTYTLYKQACSQKLSERVVHTVNPGY